MLWDCVVVMLWGGEVGVVVVVDWEVVGAKNDR